MSMHTRTHLSIKTCCHGDDVTSFVVDCKHVGGWALRILRKDLITQHSICSFWIILVHCCHCHHKGSCRETSGQDITNKPIKMRYEHVCMCVGSTRLRSFRNRAIEDGVGEFRSVVVLVYDINDNVDGVLHLIPIQVHCVGSQLYMNTTYKHRSGLSELVASAS